MPDLDFRYAKTSCFKEYLDSFSKVGQETRGAHHPHTKSAKFYKNKTIFKGFVIETIL